MVNFRSNVLWAILIFCNSVAYSADSDIKARPVNDPLLINILNNAFIQDLNELPGGNVDVSVRLYSVANEGGCVPETHYVCDHSYYLAVSETGEAPTQAVFYLGERGQIMNVKWVRSDNPYQARLSFDVTDFAKEALEANPKLSRKVKRYLLNATPEDISITPIPFTAME